MASVLDQEVEVRIAMTAHSLIYAPLYLAAKKLTKAPNGFTVKLCFAEDSPNPKGFGDTGAFRQMVDDKSIDLCVCDPMVLAKEVWDGMGRRHYQPPGKILALLLRRPALWLMTTPHTSAALRSGLVHGAPSEEGSVACQLDHSLGTEKAVNLGRLCTYSSGSSAFRIMDYLRRRQHFVFPDEERITVEHLGDEFDLLAGDSDDKPDVIVTCDCFAAYLLDEHTQATQFFGCHRTQFLDELPFTALIGPPSLRGIDRSKRSAIRYLLKALQEVLDKEINQTGSAADIVHAFTNPANGLEPSRRSSPEVNSTIRSLVADQVDPDSEKFHKEIVWRLCRRDSPNDPAPRLFPESIRPGASWVRKAWLYSFRHIWRWDGDGEADTRKIEKARRIATDDLLAKLATSKNLLHRFRGLLAEVSDEWANSDAEAAQKAVVFLLFSLAILAWRLETAFPEAEFVVHLKAWMKPAVILGLLLGLDFLVAIVRRRKRRES